MQRRSFRVTMALLLWMLIGIGFNESVFAQAVASTRIAVVDVKKVLKSSDYFTRERGILNAAIKETEDAALVLANEIENLAKQVEKSEQRSDERRVLEARLKEQRAEFNAKRRMAQQIIIRRESEIYLHIHRVVTKVIEGYAKGNQIDLVLQRGNDAPDINNANAKQVLDSYSQPILYQKRLDLTFDITDNIIRLVNAEEPQPEKVIP